MSIDAQDGRLEGGGVGDLRDPVSIPGLTDLRLIGRGGFSTVYRARQERLARDVAVKILNVDVAEPAAREQFLRECAAAGQLAGHPNIVTVHDSGFTAAGQPYLVMEFCELGSLADRLATGPLEPAVALPILVKLAGALATAHAAGVLHRDIKPENVLFTGYGEPALADFGIAALTGGGQKSFTVSALTPNHAAPEVLDGARASAAADVYSLASTAYQVLTGSPPFQRGREEGLLSYFGRVVSEPAPVLAIGAPAGLAEALAHGLAKTPAQRSATASAFGADLRTVQRAAGWAPTDLPVGTTESVAADPTENGVLGDAVIPPPPPPAVQPAATGGNLTMLRPGRPGAAAPAPAPESVRNRTNRRWLWPVLASAAVLVLLCGTGTVLGYGRLFGPRSNQAPGGPIADPTMVGTTTSTATPTPVATSLSAPATTTSGVPATITAGGGGRTGGGSTTPAGPRIDEFRVTSQPSCRTNAPGGTFEVPVVLQWKVSGGATGSELDVDGPGLYNTYGTQATETLNFPCDGPVGTKNTHTYTVKTIGGGPTVTRTLTVSATVTE